MTIYRTQSGELLEADLQSEAAAGMDFKGLDFKQVAAKLLKANTGKGQEDLHYRAFLRAVIQGQPTSHLMKFPGAKKAREELIDQAGKAESVEVVEENFLGEMIDYPNNADEWQLYDEPGAAKAAKALTSGMRRIFATLKRELKARHDEEDAGNKARRAVSKLLTKYQNYGARDTEPRDIANDLLRQAAADALGVDVDDLEFDHADLYDALNL